MRVSARTAVLMSLPPLLWAGNAIVGRLLVGSVPPLTLNFLRWLLAALLLTPFAWRIVRRPAEIVQRWRYLLMLGLLGVATYNSMQYLALVTSTPINVTLIAASMPVWMLAVGALLYRVHPTRNQILGALLSLAGVLFVIARGDWATLARVQFVPGDFYILVAIIAWAFYSWLLARPPASLYSGTDEPWHWASFLWLQMLFGLLGSGAAAASEAALGAEPIRWTGGVVLALFYVALGPSLLAYRCWGLGIAEGGPALAAFFSNLTPLFAALLSIAVFGDTPHWYHGMAFLLIVAGIVVSSGRSRQNS